MYKYKITVGSHDEYRVANLFHKNRYTSVEFAEMYNKANKDVTFDKRHEYEGLDKIVSNLINEYGFYEIKSEVTINMGVYSCAKEIPSEYIEEEYISYHLDAIYKEIEDKKKDQLKEVLHKYSKEDLKLINDLIKYELKGD